MREKVPAADLTPEESQAVLRALGYYQVHLFDEISKRKASGDDVSMLEGDSKNSTSAIKKIHKMIEGHK